MTDKVNYALAPAGATHYDFFDGDFYWLKCERAWMYFYNGEWCHCEDNEQPMNEKEIPARERELNRLADICEEWPTEKCYMVNGCAWIEWQHRRAERIEAGLIEVDNPVTSSLTNSQAKEVELDMLKGEPEYTHAYIRHGVSNRCTIFCDEKDARGYIVVRNTFDEFVLVQAGHVYQLKTPEQKAKETFIDWFEGIESNNCTSQPLSVSIYNELTEQGVDLAPLIKELNK